MPPQGTPSWHLRFTLLQGVATPTAVQPTSETSMDCAVGAEAPFNTRGPAGWSAAWEALGHTRIPGAPRVPTCQESSGDTPAHAMAERGARAVRGNLLRVEVHHNGFGVVHHSVLEVAAVLHVEGAAAAC